MQLNDLSENQVTIYGKPTYDLLEKTVNETKKCLVLIDIEGNEYDLLNKKTINLIKNCHIIVELHEFYKTQRQSAKKLLKELAKKFDIEILNSKLVNINNYPIIDTICNDSEKEVVFDEARPNNMRWLALKPRLN